MFEGDASTSGRNIKKSQTYFDDPYLNMRTTSSEAIGTGLFKYHQMSTTEVHRNEYGCECDVVCIVTFSKIPSRYIQDVETDLQQLLRTNDIQQSFALIADVRNVTLKRHLKYLILCKTYFQQLQPDHCSRVIIIMNSRTYSVVINMVRDLIATVIGNDKDNVLVVQLDDQEREMIASSEVSWFTGTYARPIVDTASLLQLPLYDVAL